MNHTPIERVLQRLESVKNTGTGKWQAKCPAHGDKKPSLSIKETTDHKVLLFCFAGCSTQGITAAIGITVSDLFPGNRRGKRQPMTKTLRSEIARRTEQSDAECAAKHKDAAQRATWIWSHAEPADPCHPYIVSKQIRQGIARQRGVKLVLPITGFDGDLRGVQTISTTSEKRFTKDMQKQGSFIVVDEIPTPDKPLIICEGWATACSVAELSPGACVIAALDAGNLLHVAVEARRRFPCVDLVIAADADIVGMKKGKAAALAAKARWTYPKFLPDNPAELTDFNDLIVWTNSQRREASHV